MEPSAWSGRYATQTRASRPIRIEADVDLAAVNRDAEHVLYRLAVREPVPHARDRHHYDLDAGDPRCGDNREGFLHPFDEYDWDPPVVYQVARARMDVEDVAGSPELLARLLVLVAGVLGLDGVRAVAPARLPIGARDGE